MILDRLRASASTQDTIINALAIFPVASSVGRVPMNRPALPEDLQVFVDSYDPQGKASYVTGYFQYMKTRLNFNCIMMDEYGGPNVAVVLPEETQVTLRRLGLDNDEMDDLIIALQRKIMEGEAHVQLRDNNLQPK